MNILNINDENINLLETFLKNNLPSTFRYFLKRNVDCIKSHIITIIGVTDEGIPIAYGHIDKDETVTYWLGICILDQYQSNGYGKQVIKYLVDKSNTPIIYLTVDKINTKAIALYRKFGFTVIDDFNTYYKMRLNKYDIQ